ncbi:C-type lectin BjL-like [Haliotis asinina]|uniref:C-type lectin BjL-like n=1 Tax=Haliotis asinina TaxID=109174 RepID=UPI003531ABFE
MCFRLSEFKDTMKYKFAEAECQKTKGGRLVSLDTPKKYGIVAGYMTALGDKGTDAGSKKFRVWIGLKRTGSCSESSQFEWTSESTNVPAWGKNEPDNGRGKDCGQLDSCGISDLYCHRKRRYICEVPL